MTNLKHLQEDFRAMCPFGFGTSSRVTSLLDGLASKSNLVSACALAGFAFQLLTDQLFLCFLPNLMEGTSTT